MPRGDRDRRRAGWTLALGVAGLSALALLPPAMLEAMPSLCLWRALHLPCWGCGSVRALAWLMHGHPARAWACNHNVILTAPLLAALLVVATGRTLRRRAEGPGR